MSHCSALDSAWHMVGSAQALAISLPLILGGGASAGRKSSGSTPPTWRWKRVSPESQLLILPGDPGSHITPSGEDI